MTNSQQQDPNPSNDSIDLGPIKASLALFEEVKEPSPFDFLEDSSLTDDKHDTQIESLQKQMAKLNNEKMQQDIDDQRSDRELRKTYANKILKYLQWYSISVGIIVVTNGIPCVCFDLDPTTLNYMVGSTAVAAIGLVGFIAKGLFKSK